jgi:hypothetical protein
LGKTFNQKCLIKSAMHDDALLYFTAYVDIGWTYVQSS